MMMVTEEQDDILEDGSARRVPNEYFCESGLNAITAAFHEITLDEPHLQDC